MDKRSYLGMAGHYAAMAEFLYRGYNVAVPAIDIGDDAYVVEDRDRVMWRLQVKTADRLDTNVATYQLSRSQLREPKQNELFFMFMLRHEGHWRFILIARKNLVQMRKAFEARDWTGMRGRKPKADTHAKADALAIRIEWRETDAEGWGGSFAPYLDQWPEVFPAIPGRPRAATPAPR